MRPARAGEMLSNMKRSVSIFMGVQYSQSNTLTPDSALFQGARGKFRFTFPSDTAPAPPAVGWSGRGGVALTVRQTGRSALRPGRLMLASV